MQLLAVRRGGVLYELAVEHYVRHQPDTGGWCRRCRDRGCPVRWHAAEVIRQAGVDPVLYEPPPRRPDAASWSDAPTVSMAVGAVRPAAWWA